MSVNAFAQLTIIDTNDIESLTVEYAQNQSSTDIPVSGWSTTRPTWQQGYYIWQRIKIHKTGTAAGQDTYSDAVCLTGSTGSQGTAGRSLTNTVTHYTNVALNTTKAQVEALAESNWGIDVPSYNASKPDYWVRITNTYSTGTTTVRIYYKDNGITDAMSTAASASTTAATAESNSTIALSQSVWYATSSSLGSAQGKVATLQSSNVIAYQQVKGVTVNVLFSNANTSNPASLTLLVRKGVADSDSVAKPIRFISGGEIATLPNANCFRAQRVYQFVFDGTYWVVQNLNIDIQARTNATTALGNAATALSAANGKNNNFYSLANQPPTGATEGDTWFVQEQVTDDNGNVIDVNGNIVIDPTTQQSKKNIVAVKRYHGDNWVLSDFTSGIFATIDAGKITTGILNGIEINSHSDDVSITYRDAETGQSITKTRVFDVNIKDGAYSIYGGPRNGTVSNFATFGCSIETNKDKINWGIMEDSSPNMMNWVPDDYIYAGFQLRGEANNGCVATNYYYYNSEQDSGSDIYSENTQDGGGTCQFIPLGNIGPDRILLGDFERVAGAPSAAQIQTATGRDNVEIINTVVSRNQMLIRAGFGVNPKDSIIFTSPYYFKEVCTDENEQTYQYQADFYKDNLASSTRQYRPVWPFQPGDTYEMQRWFGAALYTNSMQDLRVSIPLPAPISEYVNTISAKITVSRIWGNGVVIRNTEADATNVVVQSWLRGENCVHMMIRRTGGWYTSDSNKGTNNSAVGVQLGRIEFTFS